MKCLLKTVRGRSAASLPDMIIWVQVDFMKITEPQTQWTFSRITVWCATKSGTASRRSRRQQGQERFKTRFFDTHVRNPSKTTRQKKKRKKKKTYSDFCASSWNTHGVPVTSLAGVRVTAAASRRPFIFIQELPYIRFHRISPAWTEAASF